MLSRTEMHVHNSISSSVQYSYSCHYFSPCCRRFWSLFPHFLSCFSFAFSCPCYYFTILLSLRVGPSIAVSSRNGPSFATFFLSSYLLRTLLVPLCSLFYATRLVPSPPIMLPVFLLGFLVLVFSHGFLTFSGLQLSSYCIETQISVAPSISHHPCDHIRVPSYCVPWLFRFSRAHSYNT